MKLVTYSEKGMVLMGADADLLARIGKVLPKAMLSPGRGGHVMSRRWEPEIRKLLTGAAPVEESMNVANPPPKPVRVAKIRAKQITCNCPATVARYDKRFPHKPGSVPGCHMGPDGAAVDGVIRCQPLRMCKACLETDSNLSWMFDREMQNPLPDQCFGTRGA